MVKIAIVKFPGTNCDEDVYHVLKNVFYVDAEIVWYKNFSLNNCDAVVIPGGFSYGDWLRAGAIAARTHTIEKLLDAKDKKVPVLGICNGFQILVEAELLPGALLMNKNGRFICRWVRTYVERPRGPWLSLVEDGYELHMPVAHGEGRYYVDEEIYRNTLLKSPLIRYADGENPNGSVYNIAGVASEDGLILGLMPHPERSSENILIPKGFKPGGRIIFESLVHSLRRGW